MKIKSTDGRNLIESDCDLKSALENAVNSHANLCGAYLRGAYLRGADLYSANLRSADLCGADLRGADLRDADLRDADLRDAKNADGAIATTCILPDGELIGWKKAEAGLIVQLRIPADARRSNSTGRKCRTERAEVLAIHNPDGIPAAEAFSCHDNSFRYEVGATVFPAEPFDENQWNECSSGIHFYITRLEAENHV